MLNRKILVTQTIWTFLLILFTHSVFSQYTVNGLITDSNTEGIPNARVTLFNNDVSVFFEARTNDDGVFNFIAIPSGQFTLGATTLNKEYKTINLDISEDQVNIMVSLADETEQGNWEIIMDSPEPLGGTNMGILLPDGKIFYCHNTKDPFLFDPETNDTVNVIGDQEIQGCVAPALLPNGQMIFVGGADKEIYGPGTKLVKTFDPITENWEVRNDILDYRWYPTMIQLSDDNLLITGGGGLDNPVRVTTSEIYNPSTYTTVQVDDIAIGNEVSPIVLLYSGKALMTHRPPQLFDPTTQFWTSAADFVQGERMPNSDHSDHELVLLPDGRAVAVGYKSFDPTDYGNILEIYNPQTDEWTLGQNFLPIRSRAKTVLLPDKKILVMGGEKEDPNDPTFTNEWNYMRLTDLYDPFSDNWRRLEDLNIAREYHCNTVLVPDGRIIAIGGEGSPGNEPDNSIIEAFQPPYLFKGIRPEIHNLNKQEFLRGETIEFDLEKTNSPTAIHLLSLQSVTHFMNTGNNRFLELDFVQSENNISAVVPSDSLGALSGYYMLFAMVDDIPSIGEIIKIGKGEIITNSKNNITESLISIYPNPTTDLIQLNGVVNSNVEIYDSSGNFLETSKSLNNDNTFNLAKYSTGVYYIKIENSEKSNVYKVVKQ